MKTKANINVHDYRDAICKFIFLLMGLFPCSANVSFCLKTCKTQELLEKKITFLNKIL